MLSENKVKFLMFMSDVYDICSFHGGSITGGARTDRRNQIVGGVENSWHRWERGGLAVDLAFDTPEGRAEAIDAFELLNYEVIGPYPRSGHLHVEPRG